MDYSMPCKWITSLMNATATDLAIYGWRKGIKWVYLLNLSTTTKIIVNTFNLGSPSIKYIVTSSHTFTNDCRSPPGAIAKFMCLWHTSQLDTIFSTSFLTHPIHSYVNRRYVFYTPKCPLIVVSWNSIINVECSVISLEAQIFPSTTTFDRPRNNQDGILINQQFISNLVQSLILFALSF